MPEADPSLAENRPPVVVRPRRTLRGMLSAPVPCLPAGRPSFTEVSAGKQGEAVPAQIPSGLCGVNSRGLDAGGIFTPHFERSGIVAGPPADLPAEVSTQAGPSQFRSDIFKQTPPRKKFSPKISTRLSRKSLF